MVELDTSDKYVVHAYLNVSAHHNNSTNQCTFGIIYWLLDQLEFKISKLKTGSFSSNLWFEDDSCRDNVGYIGRGSGTYVNAACLSQRALVFKMFLPSPLVNIQYCWEPMWPRRTVFDLRPAELPCYIPGGGGGGEGEVVSLDSSHHPLGTMADIENNVFKINTPPNWY